MILLYFACVDDSQTKDSGTPSDDSGDADSADSADTADTADSEDSADTDTGRDSEDTGRPDSEDTSRPDSEDTGRPDSEDTGRPDSEDSGRPDSEAVETGIGIALTYFALTLSGGSLDGGLMGSAIYGTYDGAWGCYALGDVMPSTESAATACEYCEFEFFFTVEDVAPYPGYDATCDYFPDSMIYYWDGFEGGLGWGDTGYVDVVWPGSGNTYSLLAPVFLYYQGGSYAGWYPFAYGYDGNGWEPQISRDAVYGMSFWNYYAYEYVVP